MAEKKEKIPLYEVKKFPYKTFNRLINKAKKYLRNDKVWLESCKEYNVNPDIIELIPTMFGTLDVSAKTNHGIVILNYKLLCDGDFFKDFSYLIHEYRHWLQQCNGDKPTKSSEKDEYLENPFEQDAFKNQIEYISNHFGEQEAEKYVDKLLEHHEVDDTKEKNKLEDILLEKV